MGHVTRISRILAAVAVTILGVAALARALPQYSRDTKAACAACHVSVAGGPELSEFGKAFQGNRKNKVTTSPVATEYVGNDRCKTCHLPQHKSWLETRHAHALETLKTAPDSTAARMAKLLKLPLKGKPIENEACITCHVIGHKLAGGYPADSARVAAVSNVGCEACHGPGARHVRSSMADKKKTIHGKPSATLCVTCHVPAVNPGFDYEAQKTKVHPVTAAK
jgi:hypothetical protein